MITLRYVILFHCEVYMKLFVHSTAMVQCDVKHKRTSFLVTTLGLFGVFPFFLFTFLVFITFLRETRPTN